MGKYLASPWGEIRGKLGKSVGGKWKGIKVIRAWVIPKNPKTVRQTNDRMAVLGTLGHIAKENLKTLIWPIWEQICKKKRLQLTGSNLFVKVNARTLRNSIPDKNKPVGENNFPDYTKILISTGKLEPTSSISANLCSNQRKSASINQRPSVSINQRKSASIKWNPDTYQNGTPDDEVYIALYQKPSSKKPFGKLTLITGATSQSCRVKDGSRRLQPANPKRSDAEVIINHRLSTINCFIYLFFYNKDIGYSPSKGVKLH